MKRIILAALVGVLVTSTAEATYVDGNELKRLCGDQASVALQSICVGYITGIADELLSLQPAGFFSDDWPPVCVPWKVIKIRQMTDVVKKYLADHPEKLHLVGSLLVNLALREAFPCKK